MTARAFLDYVLPWLVDHPDEVEIAELEGERGEALYELTVHADDMGKVIGRRGRVVRSLRVLARAAGDPEGRPVSVEVVD